MSLMSSAAGQARRLGPIGVVPALTIELTEALVGRLEREAQQALRVLLGRLDDVGRPLALGAGSAAPPSEPVARTSLDSLLARAVDQDTVTGRSDWYASVVAQLVPDEARIIAALVDAPPPPLIHVLPRRGAERILENASLVGRLAALTVPDLTPAYVSHLRSLGLVATGPEDSANEQGYELLLADRNVRAALKEGTLGKFPARVVRRTLVLSERGRGLWEHYRPAGA